MDRFFSLLSLETNENIHTYIYIYTWLIPSKILFLSPFSCQNISTRSYSNFFPSFVKVHGNGSTRERTRTREMEVREIYIYIYIYIYTLFFPVSRSRSSRYHGPTISARNFYKLGSFYETYLSRETKTRPDPSFIYSGYR